VSSVEILIVSYNTRDLLRTCLRSIGEFAPGHHDVRVAVFENASSDGSAAMLEEEFPHTRLVKSDRNLGFAAANNALAKASSAEYLLLLNGDTEWVEDLTSPLIEALQSRPDAVVVGPRLEWPDGSVQPSRMRFPTLFSELSERLEWTAWGSLPGVWNLRAVVDGVKWPHAPAGLASADFVWATCWMLRRQDVQRYGLFDERFQMYDEDLDFCFRMRAAGREILYEPRVRVVHVGGASSTTLDKSALTNRARRLFYRVHFGRAAAASYEPGLRAVVAALHRLEKVVRLVRRRRRVR
jgi:GT2 family glycosyltransferase